MEYILFNEFITLGKLLKEIDVISSGGAAKYFLTENDVLLNGEYENRRGKKLFNGDLLEIPDFDLHISIKAASPSEIAEHKEEEEEKARVKAIVSKMNKENKKSQPKNQKKVTSPKEKTKPRFPGA